MPAADEQTLYRIEDAVETQLVDIINDATSLGSSKIMRWLDSKDGLVSPRVEVEVQLGAPKGKHKHAASGYLRHDHWEMTILIRVITNHDDDSASTHHTVLGQVRAKMEDWQELSELLVANLPYHRIGKMVWSANTNTIDPEARERVTEMTYDSAVEIRSDAWPV